MKIIRLLVALLFLASACEAKPGKSAKASSDARAVAPSVDASSLADAEPATPSAPARDAARRDADGEACQKAYADTKKLVEGLRETLDTSEEAPDAPPTMLPEQEWLTRCRKLPAAMQKCLSIQYAIPHKQECQETQQALAPEDARELQELMGK